LTYQWLLNDLAIPGGTAASLTLTNVQPWQAGQYAVTVTNTAGSITSFPAPLGVSGSGTLTPIVPRLSAALSGGQAWISFQANPGRIYSWQISTDLVSWSVLDSFVSAGSAAQLTIPLSSATRIQFYRATSP
jgi:hypothetical protein